MENYGVLIHYMFLLQKKKNPQGGAQTGGGEGVSQASSTTAATTIQLTNPNTPVTPGSPSIFVAGLAPETDAPALRQLFSRFGEIADARILTDKATGQAKGVGFVDFVLPLSAAAAIDLMNNQIYNGRNLKVSYATQKSKTNQSGSSGALSGYPPFPSSGYSDGYMFPQMGLHSYY